MYIYDIKFINIIIFRDVLFGVQMSTPNMKEGSC